MINSSSTTTDFRPDDNADTPGSISDDHDMSWSEEEERDGDDESEDTELSKIEICLPIAFLLNTSPWTKISNFIHYTIIFTTLHYKSTLN